MKKLLAVLLVLILAPLGASAFFFSPGGSSGSGTGTTNASDLSSGTIPAARIGDNSVTSTKLLDNTVASGKIADGTIVNADINASAAIAGSKLQDNSVTATKVQCTGTKDNTTYLRMDGTCAAPAGTGDVVGPASATDGYFALWDNTTGKLLKDGFSSVNPAFSTINVTGANALNLGTGSANAGSARFKNATNNFYFQILGGVSGADIGWTLPTADPAGNGYWITASSAGVLTYTNGALYATLADPTFTGVPAAPTAAADTDTTQIATTAYVIGQGYAKLVSPSFTTPSLGAASATTLDTGQGANELYAMDQNVRTTDNVTHNTVTATEFISSAADNTRGAVIGNTADLTGANLAAGKIWFNNTSNLAKVRNGDNSATLTLANTADPVFTGSVQLPNGANPTVDAAGEIAIDSSAAPGGGLRWYGAAAYSVPSHFSKCTTIDNAVDASDYPLEKFPQAITITNIKVYSIGDNVVGGLDECTGTNGVCSSVTAVDADITAADGVEASDDGSLTNPGIAAGNWIRWHTTSHTGTNTSVSVCLWYTYDLVN